MSMSENFVHCLRGLNGVSLHDCHVTRIDRRGGSVELTLPRGVWLLPGHPDNPGETIRKTRAAMLRIPVDMTNVPQEDVFRPTLWDRFAGDDYRACAFLGPVYR